MGLCTDAGPRQSVPGILTMEQKQMAERAGFEPAVGG